MVTKYSVDRFESQIDRYFFCVDCDNVSILPLECASCESLLCTDCAQELIESSKPCPYCKTDLQIRKTSVYALNIYSAYMLSCSYKSNGCIYRGNVENMLGHEASCEYAIFTCSSPLCGKECLLRDKYSSNPLVCSDICGKVVEFETVLDTNDET